MTASARCCSISTRRSSGSIRTCRIISPACSSRACITTCCDAGPTCRSIALLRLDAQIRAAGADPMPELAGILRQRLLEQLFRLGAILADVEQGAVLHHPRVIVGLHGQRLVEDRRRLVPVAGFDVDAGDAIPVAAF